MKTRLLIASSVIAISIISFLLVYTPPYMKCQSFGGTLQSLDTCILSEKKWMACDEMDAEHTCIIDGIKFKDMVK